MLVTNQKNPKAAVKGSFLFQRKSGTEWQEFETIPLSSVKGGEGYKLELHSEELLKFLQELRGLYEIHNTGGIPRGSATFVKTSRELAQLAKLSDADVNTFLGANASIGLTLLEKLLHWAINMEEPSPVIEKLLELGPSTLRQLKSAIGIQSLKSAVETWENNIDNADEEFWQSSLAEHSFVLEQIFSWPVSIVKGKAYMGGKSVLNHGGNVVDFLMKNQLTQNAALIEIKTPATALIGSEYRSGGIYNTSRDVAGSVIQVLNYKHSLLRDYRSVTQGREDLFSAFDPHCVIIIGNAGSLNHSNKTKCFELFRGQLQDVQIITYDELFEKTKQMIRLLEGPADQNDDIPF